MAQPLGESYRLAKDLTPATQEDPQSDRPVLTVLPGIIEVDGQIRLIGVEYAEPGIATDLQEVAFCTPHDPDETPEVRDHVYTTKETFRVVAEPHGSDDTYRTLANHAAFTAISNLRSMND